jgi:hypothetical protein
MGNVTGGRKFARHYFGARRASGPQPPFSSAGLPDASWRSSPISYRFKPHPRWTPAALRGARDRKALNEVAPLNRLSIGESP